MSDAFEERAERARLAVTELLIDLLHEGAQRGVISGEHTSALIGGGVAAIVGVAARVAQDHETVRRALHEQLDQSWSDVLRQTAGGEA